MFALFLAMLGLVGGSVATYFLMDAPRRRIAGRLQRLDQEELDQQRTRDRLNQDHRQLSEQIRQFEAGLAEHRKNVRDWNCKVEEFDKRVISYSDLETENRMLKLEVKNLVVQVAYLEQNQKIIKSAALDDQTQRNEIAKWYLDETIAAARKGLTANNYHAAKQRVQSAVERIRSQNCVYLPDDEKQVFQELRQLYERSVRAAVEREEQASIREKIREEQQLERQAKQEIEKAEQERRSIELALQKAMADVSGKHAAEIELLREQLSIAEAKSRRTISLAQITRSGYVYVISNPGSFGREIFKIGMTRRLEPMDRVHELGDASVPFPFDVHMMITSDDAPKLEKDLHHEFRTRRVNRINLRKEFFRVTIDEIATAVRKHHGGVHYTADAEALEYIQSQSLSDADLADAEAMYEKAEDEEDGPGTASDD
jgi:hypothetical protein